MAFRRASPRPTKTFWFSEGMKFSIGAMIIQVLMQATNFNLRLIHFLFQLMNFALNLVHFDFQLAHFTLNLVHFLF